MTLTFAILAFLTVSAAIAAMTLRNLVHCALALAVAFAGLAGLYLRLDAQFVGFAQILVYVGAVAILIVFAILLTRGGGHPAEGGGQRSPLSPSEGERAGVRGPLFPGDPGGQGAFNLRASLSPGWLAGLGIAAVVFALLTGMILSSKGIADKAPPAPSATVRQIGDQLMTRYVLPLEIIGLLLTAALIGAVIIAMREKESK